MSGVVQVEANLMKELSVHLHYRKIKMLLKREIFKVISHVALAHAFSEILKFQIFNHEKVGQGHWVQLSQWYHSLANNQIFKSCSVHFCARSHRSSDINI